MASRRVGPAPVALDENGTIPIRNGGLYPMETIGKEATRYGSLVVDTERTGRTACLCCPGWLGKEFKTLFNLSWTMVLAALLTNLLAPIGLMFAGHLGVEELGGVALGNTILNIFGNAVGIGLSTACDTFFAQTYGSGNKKLVGVHLQRGCYVILLFAFPCWMILLNTESLLVSLGQEPIIAKISADYILHYMPVIPFIFLFHIFSKYLRNQNIIVPTLIAGATGVGVTALSAYLFVNVMDLRVHGCAYAQMLGFLVFSSGCIAYSVFSPNCRECWDGFTWEALQDWGSFANLAIYGMFLVLEQIGAFEVGTILAGLLGQVELGAQTILFQIETITFMIPVGVGIACNIRIGHLLGANDPVQTRRSIYVGYLIIWTVTVVTAILLATLRFQIPRMFTDDSDVIDVSSQLLLIMALYAIFEGTVGTSAGMLRGCGRQRSAALIAFVGYFIVGLPIGIALMFYTDLKTAGFWWGVTIGIVTQAFFYVAVLFCTDWEKEAEDAQTRAGLAGLLSSRTEDEDLYDDEEFLLSSSSTLGADPFTRTSSQRRDSLPLSSSRQYCGEFDTSLPSVAVVETKSKVRLTKREMICRRGLTIFLCVLMLLAGLVLRFMFPPVPVSMSDVVTPAGGTV